MCGTVDGSRLEQLFATCREIGCFYLLQMLDLSYQLTVGSLTVCDLRVFVVGRACCVV